ncbi:MAG: prolipoprotein diacylglyceryl transferase [bacterium]
MINFLHTNIPTPILISFGSVHIYWYGLLMMLAILAAASTSLKLTEYYEISKNMILDFAFYLIIGCILGARIYYCLLYFPYYAEQPLNMFKIWEGGISIHGALIAGILISWIFAKKKKINFLKLASIIAPGLALGQAIGRFGNYFNQELFGRPTNLPWGIPINVLNRPPQYFSDSYFHPTFLYESLGNFIIFIILISLQIYIIKKKKINETFSALIVTLYFIFYSFLRFMTEFIRVDESPVYFDLRFPQIVSIATVFFSVLFFVVYRRKKIISS